MVATSPVHQAEPKSPTPIEAAKEKAKTAAREGKRMSDDMPVRFVIPADSEFATNGEYMDALDLRFIARKVIEETGADLSHIDLNTVDFVWKRKGGKDRGKPRYCIVKRQDDVAKFHGGKTWLVALSADHCREMSWNEVSTRGQMYFALAQIGFDYNEQTEETTPKLNPPDLVMFWGELQHYGPWRRELTVAKEQFRQANLPGV